jgi:hypothetical protein
MSFVMRDVEPEKPEGGAENHSTPPNEEIEGLAQEETEFVTPTAKKPINQTAMMLFGILTIGAAGLWVMNARTAPQAARAASDPQIVAAQSTITEFMQKGKSNVSLLRKLLDSTAQIVEQFKFSPVVQVPLSELKANPFHFATAKPAAADDSSDVAKKRKEAERLAIQTSVRALKLQSLVIRPNHKACMINNVLYQEGEAVDDFTVESITNEGVVVKNGPYRFRLQIAR